MRPVDILVIAVIAVIIGFVVGYLYRSKKRGVKCIGCPDSGSCSGHCSGCSGHCGHKHEEKIDSKTDLADM